MTPEKISLLTQSSLQLARWVLVYGEGVSCGIRQIAFDCMMAAMDCKKDLGEKSHPSFKGTPLEFDIGRQTDILAFLKKGEVIRAIKAARDGTTMGLKEAKELVESLPEYASRGIKVPGVDF